MDLFNQETEMLNYLPYDGTANYYGKVLSTHEANSYLDVLLNNVSWRNDEVIMAGKHIVTSRKVAWYAGEEYDYTYSGIARKSLLWIPELLALKELVEKKSGETYNSCLLNLYHNGEEGLSWHSDRESSMGKNKAIASLSLGAERKFAFKHKQTGLTRTLILEHGSLLVMKGTVQTHWLHSLPKTTKVRTPRVNLTFRTVV